MELEGSRWIGERPGTQFHQDGEADKQGAVEDGSHISGSFNRIDSGSTNYSLQTKPIPLPVFVNVVFLECGHAQTSACHPWLLVHYLGEQSACGREHTARKA